MNKKLITAFAIFSSVLCIVGGMCFILGILGFLDIIDTEKVILIGLGLYFIGQGIFVGPMLLSNK